MLPDEAQADTAITIFIDADACPVKDEVYKVAQRYKVKVFVVANAPIQVPKTPAIERILVAEGPDVADDWIAARARSGGIVITADVPLAARCIKTGAAVIAPYGKAFTPQSIGDALATRDLMDSLRSGGEITGGPKPFTPRDRSAFLSALDLAISRFAAAWVSRRAGLGVDGNPRPIPISVESPATRVVGLHLKRSPTPATMTGPRSSV